MSRGHCFKTGDRVSTRPSIHSAGCGCVAAQRLLGAVHIIQSCDTSIFIYSSLHQYTLTLAPPPLMKNGIRYTVSVVIVFFIPFFHYWYIYQNYYQLDKHITRDVKKDSRLSDNDKDHGPKTWVQWPKSRTFDFAGVCHATNTHNFMGQVWLGLCASTLFSPCVA